MGSAPTVTGAGAGKDSNWDQHFFILVYGREKKQISSYAMQFPSFWQLLRSQVASPENISQVVSGIVRQ